MSAKDELLEELQGEAIEGIVFGAYGWDGYCEEDLEKPIPLKFREKPLNWNQALPLLEGWSFDGGYGAPHCYAVYVWTRTRVIFVRTYDGSTSLTSVPRHPCEGAPHLVGGG